MKLLITGATGFIARNLVANLQAIRDGKNRTRPNLHIEEIYEYSHTDEEDVLETYCRKADFVFHLAGVNRPEDPKDFMSGNIGFTERLLEILLSTNRKVPVLMSSSAQATLEGRYADSIYGKSKKEAEELVFQYGKRTGSDVCVYRFPNVIGKWIRPNYNSAIGTFCYNIARGIPITVNDPSTELELLFIDDLIEEMYDALEGHPHHADYPKAGEIRDGIPYNGITPYPNDAGRYCYVPVTHKATLGTIVDLLHTFHDQPQSLIIPAIPNGSLEKKLYSMYLSYLPKDKTIFDLKMNCDDRGSFTELFKTINHGQVSVNISKPGVTKGQHWHNSKWEFFIVVSGHGLIQERKIGSDEILEFEVSGDRIQAVQMLPGYTHNIINLSETENLVTVMWANELFDPGRPDTFYESV